jgi:hypothetical protein
LDIYLYTLLAFAVFLAVIHLLTGTSKYKIPATSYPLIVCLGVIVAVKFAMDPILIYGDKYSYQTTFENISILNLWLGKDVGFSVYTFVIKQIADDATFYFIVTAFLYLIGYFVFARSFFEKRYAFFFLLSCFVSFGFSSYGVNTIRGGLALSLLLIGISYHKKMIWFFAFSILAILCHKSMLLPFVAFYLTRYNNTTKFYLYFWILCLVISFLNVSFITNFIQAILGESDDRYSSYMSAETLERYKAGFRVDFIIYSAIPILVGRFYLFKLKLKDVFYQRLFNTYLFANAIWLLVIRMAFTDRMAYLSWFLIPFILLYPLLKYPLRINQKKWVIIILLGIFGFTSFMYFK